MKLKNKGRLIGIFLLMVSQMVMADFRALPDFKWPVEPTSGMYFDPTQPGNGLGVELMPVNGQPFFFGAFYHYDPNGAPTWFTFQSFLHQASLAEYTTTGVPATVTGPWIQSTGGQCFDCAYTAPSTVATPFQRTLNVIDGRHLQMAASGNAAALNMQRSEAVIAAGGQTVSQALLNSGTVWAVQHRTWRQGVLATQREGWVRFRKRKAGEVRPIFGTFETTPPAWLVVGHPNDQQPYELVCIGTNQTIGVMATVGRCPTAGGPGILEDLAREGDNINTFLLDPVTDRIRVYSRCVLVSGGVCSLIGQTPIQMVGDVIDAGVSNEGRRRLVIRHYALFSEFVPHGWKDEYELTAVNADQLAEAFPFGVPATP